jgi:hypothetical protein
MNNKYPVASFVITILLFSSVIAVPGAFADKGPRDIQAAPPIHIKRFTGTSPSGYSPQIILSAYGFNKLTCSHNTTTDWTDPNLCGHGQTIAIVDAYDDPNIASDLQTFNNQFGLPACPAGSCLVKVEPQGTPRINSGWALETSLDVEWAHSIAPGAKIVLVESTNSYLNNLLGAVDAGVGQGAQQLSMSWGSTEFSSESSYDYHFNSATTSFFASSGDSGTGVEYPAASPYVVSVGGTTLNVDSFGNYLGETAWSGSGGGVSSYESKPGYQTNFQPYTARTVPDVAYVADPNTGVSVYDTVTYNGQSGWFTVGGTSAGAPQWAASAAIANGGNAKLASASFGASNALYNAAVGAQSNPQTIPYTNNYHDIITGSNGACGPICNAGPGYDEVTGLGSLQSNNLISYLEPVSSSLDSTSTSVSLNPVSVNVGGQTTVTATVSDTKTPANTPSGVVTFSDGGAGGTFGTASCVTSGSNLVCTTSYTASNLSLNTSSISVSITGSYGGDPTHSTSSGLASLTVSATIPAAPTGLSATTTSSSQINLSWIAPSSNGGSTITGYEIDRSANGGSTWSTIVTNTASASTIFTDTGLAAGTTYTYKVEAINSVGTGPSSNTASATTSTATSSSLSVRVSTSGSYLANSLVTITVNVTPGFNGATVNLTVTNQNTGGTSTASGITDSSGTAQFQFKISKHTPSGTVFNVNAQASASGYTSGSAFTSFTTH